MSYAMEAIGWTLIHFCWQAAAIVLLYRLVDAVMRRSRSHVRYVAALAALLIGSVIQSGSHELIGRTLTPPAEAVATLPGAAAVSPPEELTELPTPVV